MQLWKTRHSHSHRQVFSKDVKQPHSSETHRHLHTLLPTLGQSSGSRRHRLLDSLSGRETRACPPSKKLTRRAPAAVAKTQRLHRAILLLTEVARCHGHHARLNQVQARHPVPCVPRLPRKTTADVRLCHACHACHEKGRWM